MREAIPPLPRMPSYRGAQLNKKYSDLYLIDSQYSWTLIKAYNSC